MVLLLWVWFGCTSSEALAPGDIICGEGTRPYGDICVPKEDTGDTIDTGI